MGVHICKIHQALHLPPKNFTVGMLYLIESFKNSAMNEQLAWQS